MTAATGLVQRVGGKRFALALLVLASAMIARALLWIDGAQLVELLKSTLGLYAAANVGGRVTDAIKTAIAARQASAAGAAP